MAKEAYIHTRIDFDLKQQAELVFAKIGISLTDAVSLFLTQVTLRDGLPFPLTIPQEDMDYQRQKNELLESQKARLTAMIREAKEEGQAGQALSPEEARIITGKHLKKLRTKYKGQDELSR